ncbi:MAG: NTPase [candidate division WOR-3 bacterium]
MKIFISGSPGVGKTTLIKRLFLKNPQRFYGFWTEEIMEGGKRVGFKVITTWGESGVLAHIKLNSHYRVGKYAVDVSGFEKLVLPKIKNPLMDKILILDEIGKMEMFSKGFVETVERLIFLKDLDILATIPLKNVHPLIRKIKENFEVVYLTVENRNKVFEDLTLSLFQY